MNEIYKITSKTSNKSYIGKTTKCHLKRFKEHVNNALRGQVSHFYNALRKYGADDFIVEVLESNIDINILGYRERFWINKFNTYFGDGYNMNEGGGNGHNPHSEETKQKISSSWTEERKNKHSSIVSGKNNPMYGYVWSDEQLKTKSEKLKGKEKPQSFYDKQEKTWTAEKRKEHGEKMKGKNNPMYGKKCSEERAKKISESNKNAPKIKCEFCGNEFNNGNYIRWHGEKCKLREKDETDTLEKVLKIRDAAMLLESQI